MIKTNLYENIEERFIREKRGPFSVVEYARDLSVSPDQAQEAYFASEMSFRKRQLIAEVTPRTGVIAQKGMMQLMLGDLKAETDVRSAGGFVKQLVGSKLTGETAIKPRYSGEGTLVLEPTFKFIILEDLSEWNTGLVVDDGLFLACEENVDISIAARTNVSSAVLGGEGLFNTSLSGNGVCALECPMPREELIEVNMVDDVVKIDGNMAIAWSRNLDFTVERTTPTLFGSMMAGEGLVNVYRGTGRILIAPVQNNRGISVPANKR